MSEDGTLNWFGADAAGVERSQPVSARRRALPATRPKIRAPLPGRLPSETPTKPLTANPDILYETANRITNELGGNLLKWIDYQSPTSVREAVALLNEAGERARPLAGGTDLLVQLRVGAYDLDSVVDVKDIPELNELNLRPRQRADHRRGDWSATASTATRPSAASIPASWTPPASSAGRRFRGAPRSAATSATPPQAPTPSPR